jgi:hypothetical protein
MGVAVAGVYLTFYRCCLSSGIDQDENTKEPVANAMRGRSQPDPCYRSCAIYKIGGSG